MPWKSCGCFTRHGSGQSDSDGREAVVAEEKNRVNARHGGHGEEAKTRRGSPLARPTSGAPGRNICRVMGLVILDSFELSRQELPPGLNEVFEGIQIIRLQLRN